MVLGTCCLILCCIFEKYGPRTDYRSGTERDGPRGKPVATPSKLSVHYIVETEFNGGSSRSHQLSKKCTRKRRRSKLAIIQSISADFNDFCEWNISKKATDVIGAKIERWRKVESSDFVHRQIDGVAMGSPLANISVGYYEALLFKRVNKPLMYYRYADNAFAVFNDEDECNEFFSHLNSLHSSLRFTFEKERNRTILLKEWNRTLPFLDVLVEKNDDEFITTIYRKSTFTGRYIRWNSFCPINGIPI